MSLIEEILEYANILNATQRVKSNKGAAGIDEMPTDEIESYIKENHESIVTQIRNKEYKPQPVRRVYIPK